jgi:hypothetical protein
MKQQSPRKKRRISDDAVRDTILDMCEAAGPEGRVDPGAVARALYPEEWQSLLSRIRLMARQLTRAGHLVILRKGEPADPDDFKGVYRLRIGPEPFPREE